MVFSVTSSLAAPRQRRRDLHAALSLLADPHFVAVPSSSSSSSRSQFSVLTSDRGSDVEGGGGAGGTELQLWKVFF